MRVHIRNRRPRLMLAAAALLAASGLAASCHKKRAGAGAGDQSTGQATAAGGTAAADSPPAPADLESVGVPECDAYLRKMADCLAKMPPDMRKATGSAFEQSRRAWKGTAATPQGRETLKAVCSAAMNAINQNPICR